MKRPSSGVSSRSAAILTMDVPGLASEDVDVTVEGHVLRVSGERTRTELEDATSHRRERRFGRFQRSFRLSAALNPGETLAAVAEGVLTVTIPKSTQGNPKSTP